MKHIAVIMLTLTLAVPVSAGNSTREVVCAEKESAQEIINAYRIGNLGKAVVVIEDVLIQQKYCWRYMLPIDAKLKVVSTESVRIGGRILLLSVVSTFVPDGKNGKRRVFGVAFRHVKDI